jgi:hypothetical protein
LASSGERTEVRFAVVGTLAVLLAQAQEDKLDRDTVEIAIIVLLVVCGIGMVLVLRTVQKMTTRLALLGVLFVVGIGLYVQREELEDCREQCTCEVFGLDIEVDEVRGLPCPD